MNYDELYDWFSQGIVTPIVIQDKCEAETFIKAPCNENFDYIYHLHSFNGKILSRHGAFNFCGIYSKVDGMLYDTRYPLKDSLPQIESGKDIHNLQEEFQTKVREIINRKVDNNLNNLSSPFFVDDSFQQKLDDFTEHYAKETVRTRFLSGDTSEDIECDCWYESEKFDDSLMLEYLNNPMDVVNSAVTNYCQSHQDDILLNYYMYEIIKERIQELEEMNDSPLHRQRDIIDAINRSGAKTVNVTIQRDGQDFSFKYNADLLGRSSCSEYNTWDMSAKNRKAFRECFENDSYFYPQEITSINYRGKVLYEAEPYEMAEDFDEGFNMSM